MGETTIHGEHEEGASRYMWAVRCLDSGVKYQAGELDIVFYAELCQDACSVFRRRLHADVQVGGNLLQVSACEDSFHDFHLSRRQLGELCWHLGRDAGRLSPLCVRFEGLLDCLNQD